MSEARPASLPDLVASAAWAAVGFGLLEGALHIVLRGFPALQAAHKLGPAALWITPLGNLPLALLAVLGLAFLGRWRGVAASPPLVWAVLAALGSAAVLRAPEVLHPATVVLLALGVGTMAFRLVRARGEGCLPALRRRWAILPLLVALAFAGTLAEERLTEARRVAALPPAPPGGRDVLVILLDTVRRDRFTGARSLTPVLDSVARAGTEFRNAWAPSSWSLPSQASILTGREAHRHGANWPTLRLADSVPSVAEAFRDRGYATGAFSSNHSWVTPEYLGRGFTRFRVYEQIDLWERTTAGRVGARLLAALGRRPGQPIVPARRTIDRFLAFVDRHPERPFFGYLCFMDVNRAFYNRLHGHAAWEPQPTMASAVAAYDSALAALDTELGRLLGELERRGRLANTVVVIASDHGESFGPEEGDHDPRGHGTSLYPEQVRVPFMVAGPGIPVGEERGAATSVVDLPGMVLALAGGPDPRFPEGPALATLLTPATADSVGAVYTTLDYDRWSARSTVRGAVQYILTRSGAAEGEALFDLATDSLARESLPPTDPRWEPLRRLLVQIDPEGARRNATAGARGSR
jgi:arylsulfatase A-like enzyme